jgi:lysophospholipase L1-like esterase
MILGTIRTLARINSMKIRDGSMRTRTSWLALAGAALLTVALTVHPGAASAESNGGVRVMPLGDSITYGTGDPGGYRIGLWQRAVAGGYQTDFVGSQTNGPASLGDHDHEGHPGWRIDQIDANIVGWLTTYQPHTVLLHIGTNDIGQNYDVAHAPNRLSTLIDHITSTVPSAEVFVAQIIPLGWSSADLVNFNAAIPGIVQSKVATGKHVHLVDMYHALTTADLSSDGVHPNAGGYDKMAATWYQALLSVPGSLGNPGGGPSSTPPTTRPTTTPPTIPPATGCRVVDAVSAWNTGLTENITVTNTSTSAVNGWSLTFTLPAGQSITSGWNATYSTGTAQVTARNLSYNGALAPGASTTIGFQATHTGNSAAPTAFSFNGAACTVA